MLGPAHRLTTALCWSPPDVPQKALLGANVPMLAETLVLVAVVTIA